MVDVAFRKLISQTEEHIDSLKFAIDRLEQRKFKNKHSVEMIRSLTLMSEASTARKLLLEKLIADDERFG